ncbi:MAG: hypothetical protein ISS25_00070 [Nanoarchaeota archaeon]|nr:hypothetical protein [DPANN group archaeon]MBL7116214.1 hypothetical protein [Nanoarchaeota archaeon]
MKSTTIVTIVLVVLVILSVVQAFQLNSLKAKVAEGDLEVGSSTKTKPLSSGGTGSEPGALPASIQNLPTMVGGC